MRHSDCFLIRLGFPAARPLSCLAAVATFVAVAACQGPATATYPDEPGVLWRLDPGVLADGEILADPRFPVSYEGPPAPAVVEVGDVWVTATLRMTEAPATAQSLIGVSGDSGDLLWRYRPDGGEILSCAESSAARGLACLVRESTTADLIDVVMLEAATGDAVVAFEAPAGAHLIEAVGTDLLVLASGAPDVSRVVRYTSRGGQVWAADVPVLIPDFPPGLAVGASALVVGVADEVLLFDLDDGAALPGGGREVAAWLAEDGGIVLYPSYGGPGTVRVIGPDGVEVAVMEGHEFLFEDLSVGEGGAVYLRDPAGQVVRIDTRSGAMEPTGVILGAGNPTVAGVGPTLLFWDEVLRAHERAAPGVVAWDAEFWVGATDGILLYGFLGMDQEPPLAALRLADGNVVWEVDPRALSGEVADAGVEAGEGDGGVALLDVGGRLALSTGDSLTVLAP